MINLLYRKKYFNNIPKLKKCKEDAKYVREWILSIIWWILTRGDVDVKWWPYWILMMTQARLNEKVNKTYKNGPVHDSLPGSQ